MKTLMIPIILSAAFLLVGCELNETGPDELPTPPDVPVGERGDGFQAHYENGALTYSATIMAPTPCHEVRVNELILESAPIQVRIEVDFTADPEEMCAQVITERTISGTITLGEEPGSVTLVTPYGTEEASI